MKLGSPYTISIASEDWDAKEERIATLEAQNAALVEALTELVRIGDRKTVAWDRARAALTPDATQAAAAFVERIRAEER